MIELQGKFIGMRGRLFGLQQPALTGTLRLLEPPPPDLEKLEAWMSGLIDEVPRTSGPQSHPDPETRLAHRCIQWAIALQRQLRIPVSERFAVHRKKPTEGALATFGIAMPYDSAKAGKASLECVVDCLRRFAARPAGTAEPDPATRAAFDAHCETLRLESRPSLNPYYIETAAYELGMPVRRFAPGTLAIGNGWTSRLFQSTITDRTPAIGVNLAKDKRTTAMVLRAAGLPGGENLPAASPEEAIGAAERLGYPVVVKPADRDQGQGVAADLRDAGAVSRAFRTARNFSGNILVERHVDGFTHRLTVFDGVLVKVAKRVAGGIVGDGVRTIAQLAEEAARAPELQRIQARANRVLLTIDEEAEGLLAQSGRSPATVPAPGEYVRLRRRDNRNAGGSNVAVALRDVHPDNRALAIRAAALLRLDFAGIDLILEDIGRSWLETGGLICEVNAQPQMGTADTPTIYHDLLAAMVPARGRIPVHLVLCAGPAITPADAVAKAASKFPCRLVGHAGGLRVDGVRITQAFASGFDAFRAALQLPEAREVLCAMTTEEVVRRGLPIDRVERLTVVGEPGPTGDDRSRLEGALFMLRGAFGTMERI